MKFLRQLVWLYLLLLIFEGAFRKWVPPLSAPLLLIRDPVVVLIYFQALRHGLSFHNLLNLANFILAVLTTMAAAFGIVPGFANVLVTIYGILANYIQIPLIFLIPQILNRDDVLQMGKFFLLMVVPMALLTALQFLSSPDSFWNAGAMATHYGTVRPSATFSFSNGLAYFFAFSSAFLFFGYQHLNTYRYWLLGAATFGTLLAAACSGSRSCLVAIAIVMVAWVLCVVMKGRGGVGLLVAVALIGVAVLALSSLEVVQKGTEQMTERIGDASAVEGGGSGFVSRFFGTMFSAVEVIPYVPFPFGNGLGTGTNGAYALFTPPEDMYWPENEWERLVFECGPLLGLPLCAFRATLTISLALAAYRAFRHDNVLPILIFAAGGLLVLNGQWGGPTPLGFAIFGAGITLAACRVPDEPWDEEDGEHVHDSDHEHEHDHDPADDEHSPAHDPA
jgi:hypothetical protein